MIARFFIVIFFVFPALVAADDRPFETIESRVFNRNSADHLRSLYTNESGLGWFQNALVDYRLGTMTTNVDLVRKSIRSLSNELILSTNVFNITYYGLAFSSITFVSPDFFEKLPALNRSFLVLDRAVEMYPLHYLPHFYRSMMKLMAPSIVGGNEDVGIQDMEFVLSNMSSIHRKNDYKAFIHFFYAIYWGEKRNDMIKAETLLSNAYKLAETVEMRTNIERYRKKYEEKRGRS